MLKTLSLPIFSFSMPLSALIWFSSKICTTSPPNFSTNAIAAFKVPPVARTSSINTTLSPSLMRCFWTSIVSVPYSNPQLNSTHSPGNFPFFLMGQQDLPTLRESEGPKRKPLDSSMKSLSYCMFLSCFSKDSMTRVNISGSEMMGKMSMKLTPSLGKFSYLIVADLIFCAISSVDMNQYILNISSGV